MAHQNKGPASGSISSIFDDSELSAELGLIIAVRNSNWDAIENYLLQGAKINHLDPKHGTPLMVAARSPNSFNLCRYLLDCGAAPNMTCKFLTPLQIVMGIAAEWVAQEAKFSVKLTPAERSKLAQYEKRPEKQFDPAELRGQFGKCVDLRRAIMNAKSTIKLLIARKANINVLTKPPPDANMPLRERAKGGANSRSEEKRAEEDPDSAKKQVGLVEMAKAIGFHDIAATLEAEGARPGAVLIAEAEERKAKEERRAKGGRTVKLADEEDPYGWGEKYEVKTLVQYRRRKGEYEALSKLGGLGPDLQNDRVRIQQQKKERRKLYDQHREAIAQGRKNPGEPILLPSLPRSVSADAVPANPRKGKQAARTKQPSPDNFKTTNDKFTTIFQHTISSPVNGDFKNTNQVECRECPLTFGKVHEFDKGGVCQFCGGDKPVDWDRSVPNSQ